MHEYISTIQKSRLRNTMIIGQAGSGKSNVSNQLVQHDINQDAGIFHIDLDGTDTNTILSQVPKRRIKDVILLNLSDTDYPVAINPFTGTGTDYDATIADMFVDAFKSIWSYDDAATPDMDRTIYNAARTTLDFSGGTILDMYRMLVSEEVRNMMVAATKDQIVKKYWQEIYPSLEPREQNAVVKSTVNKLERFVSDVRIRNVLGQSKPMFDFRLAIEERKIILLKIPQSEFGLGKARTIAGLVFAQFNAVAQQRMGLLPFHVYLPDCQHVIGGTLAQMLATSGKRSISVTLTCQYLEQLGKLKASIFGNVSNWVIFRVGLTDALELEELFEWDNTRKFLYELTFREARIVTPYENPLHFLTLISNLNIKNNSQAIVNHSRHFYCRQRGEVEMNIKKALG